MSKKKSQSNSPSLFKEQIVPAAPGSGKLFDVEYTARDQPVTCLGMTFENEEARRKHFTKELRKKLKDPEFRKIEGFPIGEDEDILNLSDPPYYTACPNPWIGDFIAEWEGQKPTKPEGWTYHRFDGFCGSGMTGVSAQLCGEAYKTIVEVAEKIPNNVLEEDPKLLMWYDQAVTRIGGD